MCVWTLSIADCFRILSCAFLSKTVGDYSMHIDKHFHLYAFNKITRKITLPSSPIIFQKCPFLVVDLSISHSPSALIRLHSSCRTRQNRVHRPQRVYLIYHPFLFWGSLSCSCDLFFFSFCSRIVTFILNNLFPIPQLFAVTLDIGSRFTLTARVSSLYS